MTIRHLQGGGQKPRSVVPEQQPLSQRQQDKKLIVDDRKQRAKHSPIHIDRAVVEWVESFKFLGTHITKDLPWFKHTKTVVKRARQCLYPFRRLRRFGMGPQILKNFYS